MSLLGGGRRDPRYPQEDEAGDFVSCRAEVAGTSSNLFRLAWVEVSLGEGEP